MGQTDAIGTEFVSDIVSYFKAYFYLEILTFSDFVIPACIITCLMPRTSQSLNIALSSRAAVPHGYTVMAFPVGSTITFVRVGIMIAFALTPI